MDDETGEFTPWPREGGDATRNVLIVFEPHGDFAHQRYDGWIGQALDGYATVANHLARNVWIVRTNYSAGDIAAKLERSTDRSDILAVFELSNVVAGHWGNSPNPKLHY